MSGGSVRTALVVAADGPIGTALVGRLELSGWSVSTPGPDADLADAVEIAEQVGGLELLVVDSPPARSIAFDVLQPDEWAHVLDGHLGVARRAARAALPPMLARGRGNVVFVTSTAAQVGGPGATATAAAQGAVHGLMRGLAREFAPGGVSVNAVAPAPATPPEDVAAVVVDLLAAPHFFVGQVLGANRGVVL